MQHAGLWENVQHMHCFGVVFPSDTNWYVVSCPILLFLDYELTAFETYVLTSEYAHFPRVVTTNDYCHIIDTTTRSRDIVA